MSNYNNLKHIFKVNTAGDDKVVYKLDFSLDTTRFAILKGSIKHNLPSYNATSPVYFVTVTSNAKKYLVFSNIGKLDTSTTYFIAYKLYLPYTAKTPTAMEAIGKITISGMLEDDSSATYLTWSSLSSGIVLTAQVSLNVMGANLPTLVGVGNSIISHETAAA